VYESLFGNTREIAEAIAARPVPGGCRRSTDVPASSWWGNSMWPGRRSWRRRPTKSADSVSPPKSLSGGVLRGLVRGPPARRDKPPARATGCPARGRRERSGRPEDLRHAWRPLSALHRRLPVGPSDGERARTCTASRSTGASPSSWNDGSQRNHGRRRPTDHMTQVRVTRSGTSPGVQAPRGESAQVNIMIEVGWVGREPTRGGL
jgi:hypothetical protein